MMHVYSSKQIFEADQATVNNNLVSYDDLMERAGAGMLTEILKRLLPTDEVIRVFCGPGNNGGDGLVMARLLTQHDLDYQVKVYIVNYRDQHTQGFQLNYERYLDITTAQDPIFIKSDKDIPQINKNDVVIDAIFGIGLNRSPDSWVKRLIQGINASEATVFAVDIPSGLFSECAVSDTEAVIKADFTATIQAPKLAFFLPETGAFVSEFDVVDIHLDSTYFNKEKPLAMLVSKIEAQKIYRKREKFSHKGTYGHALIVGGSYGKIGAALLATKATLKSGAGMVTCFIPKCGYSVIQSAFPEAMVTCDAEQDYISAITVDFKPSAIGVGMGIGKKTATAKALISLFKSHLVPYVIDADALNILSESQEALAHLPINSILTPHPGELKRLIGPWKDDYEKIEKVKEFSKKHQCVVLIKGAYSMIVYNEDVYINTSGNAGMATAGSGDVLSGILTGLLAQGYQTLFAVLLGVYLHGSAGDIAAKRNSQETLIAGDLNDHLGDAYLELRNSFIIQKTNF